MTTEIIPYGKRIDNVRTLLDRLKPQIALALPKHMTPDRMARVAMTCVLKTPALLECDMRSLMGAVITCSQLGLEPDPLLGHAFLVPFRNNKTDRSEVVVIAGYRGIMKLARNSGEVSTIDAHPVHTRDEFRYAYGLEPVLRHVPFQGHDEEPGDATHYYAVCRLKDGGHVFRVMTRRDVERHRDRFVKRIKADSPWNTDFDAMALKTCIRALAKFMPASVELERLATLDDHAEAGIPQDLGAVLGSYPEDDPAAAGGAPPRAKLDSLTDSLEGAAPAATTAEPAAS
jgi:recombination protein RecT